jgi:hypothetical protein
MLWNNNDREEAKPTWLTLSQKINCVRTVEGWEIPLHGANLGAEFGGPGNISATGSWAGSPGASGGMTAFTKYTELLVAMPIDNFNDVNVIATVTGPQTSFQITNRGQTGIALTGGTLAYYYSTAPAAGVTSGLVAVGTVVGATAVAGGYNYQINGFSNLPTISGPRAVASGGVFVFGDAGTVTGATATVTSVAAFIDQWVINPLLAGYSGLSGQGITAGRMGATGGLTGGFDANEAPNTRPYFTIPFNGDSATAGGYIETGAGMSFGTSLTGTGLTNSGYYGVNAYGGSTLNFPGATAYIKVIANDPNYTQNMTFSLPAHTAVNPQQIALGNTGIAIFQGSQLITGEIPTGVYEAFFGPTAQVNNNIAVIRICKSGATANQTYKATVRVVDNSAQGLTALSTFAVSFGPTA